MRLTDNLALKLLSVMFAFTLWFYVQGRERVETAVKLRLSFSEVPEGMYIEESSASEATAWIRAPKSISDQLVKNDRVVNISLRSASKGVNHYAITQEKLRLPTLAAVTKVDPEQVTVRVAPFLQKQVRIVADYEGSMRASAEPGSITIRGDRKTVEPVKHVVTERIDGQHQKGTFRVRLLPPADGIIMSKDEVVMTLRQQ